MNRLGEFIVIPTSVAKAHRKSNELHALRQAKYKYRYPERIKRKDANYREHTRKPNCDKDWAARPFIMWDGEGPQDAGYALFGNSEGYEICHPFLSTEECLNLIIDCESENPDAIHIGYGFNYDVSMILKDLPWRHLTALHNFTRTIWKDWQIEHIPHKWFKVKHGEISCTIYDIRSFFPGGYFDALTDFGIGTQRDRDRIDHGKSSRETFTWATIEDIKEYWRLELKLGPLLADKLRDIFGQAGYIPRSWHGPGALARMALQRHKVYDKMAVCPTEVRLAAQAAFAGGRFELFKAGHVQGKVYNADINSAYPAYATNLPNLAKGKWHRVRKFVDNRFAIYHISYNGTPDPYLPYPLYKRTANNSVVWPYRCEGWYWQPEAELVKDDPQAKFIEGWVFEENDPNDRPFAFLADYYEKRKRLKNAGSPAQYTFKLIINSVYGQLAQRAGWNRRNNTPPKSHQLEWAGYITSACRATVYRAAKACGEKLVSIDTDGIFSLAPIPSLDTGERMGQWELSEYDDAIFWQSGIYALRSGGEWSKARTRGIPKGTYSAEQLLDCLHRNEPLRLAKKVFVTYGLADNGRHDELNTWQLEPHEFVMGGSGKRMHFPKACKTQCNGMHRLGMLQILYGPEVDPRSKAHWLPWLEPPDRYKKVMEDLTLFSENHLDPDDAWVYAVGGG